MDLSQIIAAGRDVLVASAAVASAVAAIRGLNKWQQELRGKADFEVARALIRSTYKLRNELANFRSMVIWAHEFPPEYHANKAPSASDEANAFAHVYDNRWKPVMQALQEFDAQMFEAEALWGGTAREKAERVRQCVRRLSAGVSATIADKASGGQDFGSDRDFAKKIRADISAISDDDTNDLSREIRLAVEGLEGFVRPHMTKR